MDRPVDFAAALTFIQDYFTTKPLGLPEMADADVTKTLDVITRAMLYAWLAGFITGRAR
jgi:hypothetical protein